MQAILIRQYGGPEVLEYGNVADPAPGPGEVLVDVHAASVNPIDWKIRSGLMRSFFDLALPHVMGRDMSGVVCAVGEGVSDYAPGDAVFGVAAFMRPGTHAERIAIATDLIGRKPAALGHAETTAVGVAGLTALVALKDTAKLQAGEKVLIQGGAGGVGHLAIQLAKHLGAHVVATARAGNIDFVRGLGADQAVDYEKQDIAEAVGGCDVVFDTIGGETHARSLACLKPGGRMTYITAAPIPETPTRDDVTMLNARVMGNPARFRRLAELAEAGAMRAEITGTFALADAAQAYSAVETGRPRGKIVIRVSEPTRR